MGTVALRIYSIGAEHNWPKRNRNSMRGVRAWPIGCPVACARLTAAYVLNHLALWVPCDDLQTGLVWAEMRCAVRCVFVLCKVNSVDPPRQCYDVVAPAHTPLLPLSDISQPTHAHARTSTHHISPVFCYDAPIVRALSCVSLGSLDLCVGQLVASVWGLVMLTCNDFCCWRWRVDKQTCTQPVNPPLSLRSETWPGHRELVVHSTLPSLRAIHAHCMVKKHAIQR
jgi:hypothetical protein